MALRTFHATAPIKHDYKAPASCTNYRKRGLWIRAISQFPDDAAIPDRAGRTPATGSGESTPLQKPRIAQLRDRLTFAAGGTDSGSGSGGGGSKQTTFFGGGGSGGGGPSPPNWSWWQIAAVTAAIAAYPVWQLGGKDFFAQFREEKAAKEAAEAEAKDKEKEKEKGKAKKSSGSQKQEPSKDSQTASASSHADSHQEKKAEEEKAHAHDKQTHSADGGSDGKSKSEDSKGVIHGIKSAASKIGKVLHITSDSSDGNKKKEKKAEDASKSKKDEDSDKRALYITVGALVFTGCVAGGLYYWDKHGGNFGDKMKGLSGKKSDSKPKGDSKPTADSAPKKRADAAPHPSGPSPVEGAGPKKT